MWVGDLLGKDESCKMLILELIEDNKVGIWKVFEKLLIFGDVEIDVVMLDNVDWFLKLNYVNFLCEIGWYFFVNQMIQCDSVCL